MLERGGGHYLLGRGVSYADLSRFQVADSLRQACPETMRRLEENLPRVIALHDRIAGRPRIAAHLASPRRIAFNQPGIFRHYPELDR
jgi:glutathione S-transferase